MNISAWWLRTSSKLSGYEAKKTTGKLGNGQLLSGCGFVQNIAPLSLSRDGRINMERTNNFVLFTKNNLHSRARIPWCLAST